MQGAPLSSFPSQVNPCARAKGEKETNMDVLIQMMLKYIAEVLEQIRDELRIMNERSDDNGKT